MAAGPAEVADSLYINGNIYTVNEDFSTATTMAVKGDRILYVGDQAGAEAYVGAGTEITDLGGKTVLPGLIEGHMHVSNLGENHLKLDCYFKSKEDILEMVRQAAKEAEPGEWIQGSGWLDTLWDEPGFPSKEELDAVAPTTRSICSGQTTIWAGLTAWRWRWRALPRIPQSLRAARFSKRTTGNCWAALPTTRRQWSSR